MVHPGLVEDAIRHGTTMTVEGNYVDTHGQSEIGFGITRLLGFDLLPRIKQINRVRLYRPRSGQPDAYPLLAPALTRPIRWDPVVQNYDQMIKYATPIRQGTASTEAILRRFTRSASHPTHQAMLEVGRAQRTIFVARFLRRRELQREITVACLRILQAAAQPGRQSRDPRLAAMPARLRCRRVGRGRRGRRGRAGCPPRRRSGRASRGCC